MICSCDCVFLRQKPTILRTFSLEGLVVWSRNNKFSLIPSLFWVVARLDQSQIEQLTWMVVWSGLRHKQMKSCARMKLFIFLSNESRKTRWRIKKKCIYYWAFRSQWQNLFLFSVLTTFQNIWVSDDMIQSATTYTKFVSSWETRSSTSK